MYLAANLGPNSGRQHLFSAEQRADAVSTSRFLTSRMVFPGKNDTWRSNVLSMGHILALLLSELDAMEKVTIGLNWAKFQLEEQSTKAAVVGPALDRRKRQHLPNNNSRLLAVVIGPALCRIISFGNLHLGLSTTLLKVRNNASPVRLITLKYMYNNLSLLLMMVLFSVL